MTTLLPAMTRRLTPLCAYTCITLLVAGAGLTGCDKKTAANKTSDATASSTAQTNQIEMLAADVVTAKAERYQPSVTVTGTLQAANRTVVQSTVNAQVQQVLADIGRSVRQGDPLVRLDIRDSQNQLAQAIADLNAAKAQANVAIRLAQKNKNLLAQGFVSQMEYERSLADAMAQQEMVKAKIAQVNTAQKMYGDTTIHAPAAGVVATRSVEVGQVVAPNQPLMEIIDTRKLEFVANIPNEAQSQLTIGQSVPFTIANHSEQFFGQISRIAPQVDPITRQLSVYVTVDPNQNNQQLKAGMFATGKLEYGQMQVGVLLPMSAVTLENPSAANKSAMANASSVVAMNPSNKIAAPTTHTPALPSGKVWVVSKDKTLRRQPVQIIRQDDSTGQYLVVGIEQGTVVVTASLNDNDAGKKVVLN